MSSRRTFFKQFGLLALSSAALPYVVGTAEARSLLLQQTEPTDEEILRAKFIAAKKRYLKDRDIGDVVAVMGLLFAGTPYVAHSLEADGPEHLVVNLRGFDCVTFIESTLALSRCIKANTDTLESYKRQLQFIRYRAGVIDEYPSRLHYFSDWIDDNQRKGVVRNVTQALGGVRYPKEIKFMSTHPSAYRQLSSPIHLRVIKGWEKEIHKRAHYFVSKDQIASIETQIHDGDIIAITTAMDGLDVSHTGLAMRLEGALRYVHAPLSKGVVQVSQQSLVDYLMASKSRTGIMVARPLEPA
jgi:hypothetical protein